MATKLTETGITFPTNQALVGVATATEAREGTANDVAMTPIRVAQAVTTIMASADALAVGTVALLRSIGGGPYDVGDTTTGGNLSVCDLDGAPRILVANSVTIVPGQWRCLGRTSVAGSLVNPLTTNARAQSTLWLRIS